MLVGKRRPLLIPNPAAIVLILIMAVFVFGGEYSWINYTYGIASHHIGSNVLIAYSASICDISHAIRTITTIRRVNCFLAILWYTVDKSLSDPNNSLS